MPRLLIVDGHNNLYRAFYAIRAPLSAPDGTPTAAAFGFLRMQQKLLRTFEPTHVAVTFDLGRESYRSALDERYKAQRQPMPDDLRVQVPITLEALRLLGVPIVQQEGIEADDLIGALAASAAAEGCEVVIASSDKDLMQLVRDPLVSMFHTRMETRLDAAGVEDVFGVPPAQVCEVLALMGDAVDNIPGCKGIGEKTAVELIRRWGSVSGTYANLDQVAPPRARKALAEHRAEVELSHRLVCLRTDIELAVSFDDLVVAPADRAVIEEYYRRYAMTSLLAELPAGPATPAIAVESRALSVEAMAAFVAENGTLAVDLEPERLAAARGETVVECHAAAERLAALLAPHAAGVWCLSAKELLGRLAAAGHPTDACPADAALAGYLLAAGEAVDLPALCARHGVSAPALGSAAERAWALARLAGPLGEALEAEGLRRVFDEIERPLVPVLLAMESAGIRLDPCVLSDLGARLERTLAELDREIRAEAGGDFNLNSPPQLAEVLFERKGLPVLRRTSKTKAPSTDADVLAELAARGFRLPGLILEYREQSKLKSTYVDALPRQVGPDGRIHTCFNQTVAATGRLSSSEPNLQNIPIRTALGREVRRAFVADEGTLLVVADYSQIELRVLAHLSGEPTLARAFATGEDIHTATAALVFGLAPALVSPDHRRAAKTINFGLIYGMGAWALSKELGVATGEAQRFIDAYFERLPRVRAYLDGVKEQARAGGVVRTLFGRMRRISGLDARSPAQRGNAERMAINAPVQGTAADLIKLAMIRLHRELAERPARLLLQVHDELVLECDAAAAEDVAALTRRVMEGVADLSVPLKADVGTGPSWAEAKS